MFEAIDKIDKVIFLYLNGLNAPWLDSVMNTITERDTWIPFYLLIIVYLIVKYRWKTIGIVVATALLITLCDQFASGFCKPFFERLRPSHEPRLANMVHLVGGRGGLYGFISSHAANTFGLAAFLFFLFRKYEHRFVWIFAWAFVVSYSRIYVGLHYPTDVILGGLSGVFWAYLVFYLYRLLPKKYTVNDQIKALTRKETI